MKAMCARCAKAACGIAMGLGALGFCALSAAQATNETGGLASAERQRIQQERLGIDQRAPAEDAACYQRFAVNDCLRAARQERRERLADLQRQELGLNRADARARAGEQLLQAEKRLSPQAMLAEAERLQEAQQSQAARLQALDERIAAREKLRAEESLRLKERQDRLQAAREAQRERAIKAAQAEAERAQFEARQAQAANRQREAAKAREQRKQGAAASPS
jgi:colicin import membrane protein